MSSSFPLVVLLYAPLAPELSLGGMVNWTCLRLAANDAWGELPKCLGWFVASLPLVVIAERHWCDSGTDRGKVCPWAMPQRPTVPPPLLIVPMHVPMPMPITKVLLAPLSKYLFSSYPPSLLSMMVVHSSGRLGWQWSLWSLRRSASWLSHTQSWAWFMLSPDSRTGTCLWRNLKGENCSSGGGASTKHKSQKSYTFLCPIPHLEYL